MKEIKSCVIPNSLEDLGRFLALLPRNPPEPCLLCAPELSGTSSAICPGTLRNLINNLHRNSPEPHQPSAPVPSGTSLAICTGTLRNLISHLPRTVQNLISNLPRNSPKPHQPSAPGVAAAPERPRAIAGKKTNSKRCCWRKKKSDLALLSAAWSLQMVTATTSTIQTCAKHSWFYKGKMETMEQSLTRPAVRSRK